MAHAEQAHHAGQRARVLVVDDEESITGLVGMALRSQGPERWKDLQRLNYTLVALVVLHAAIDQAAGHRQAAG
jgi:CheY-like chemotaxis protein